ncbi:MAG: hypothetical protein DRP42_07055 [Tenericutes bacterium]|nr:MAG: hypothetical protein DRP42_07055 [Mycoplasmatota bacterium]
MRQPKVPSVSAAAMRKACNLSPHLLGAWWEEALKSHFDYIKATRPFYWHRFPDSKAAGNLIAEQPADFIVASPPSGAMLVEAKASAAHDSLRSCLSKNVSTGQALHHRMWARAGQESMFIFIGVSKPVVEIWNGKYVADCRASGARLKADSEWSGDPAGPGLLEALREVFGE